MKHRLMKSILMALVLTVISASTAAALTFEELAGVYTCKRTESHNGTLTRYEEIVIFESNGMVTNYIYQDGVFIGLQSGIIEMLESGKDWIRFSYGLIMLHGRHVEITADFPELDTVVQIKGRMATKDLNP